MINERNVEARVPKTRPITADEKLLVRAKIIKNATRGKPSRVKKEISDFTVWDVILIE